MAKKKSAVKKTPSAQPIKKKSAGASRQKLSTIKPPPAPAVMHSAEVGAHIAQDQAIRERLRLYPRATVNEIIAMFELEGVKVTPQAVNRAKRK